MKIYLMKKRNFFIKPVKSRQLMSLIQKLIYALNVLAVIGLIFSYLSPFINPSLTWFFSFFGLGYPILLILNVLFALYWLIAKPKVAFLSIIFVLMGVMPILRTIGFNKMKEVEPGFNIMSYNIGGTHLKFSNKNKAENIKAFKDFMLLNPADIICLQERVKWQIDIFNDLFPNHNSFPKKGLGTCIYSKHPIKATGSLANDTPFNNVTWADIELNKKLIRVYSVHLSSNKVKNLTDNVKEIIDESVYILDKYNEHAIRRAEQIDQVLKHAKQCPHPVFITGDFNDVPQSFVYRQISSQYQDVFLDHGYGMAKTYNSRMPGLRIDYAFADKRLKILDQDILKTNLSDHYPIVTRIDSDW